MTGVHEKWGWTGVFTDFPSRPRLSRARFPSVLKKYLLLPVATLCAFSASAGSITDDAVAGAARESTTVVSTPGDAGEHGASDTPPVSKKADGYKGIWFDLGQKSSYGSKYSGGLGTYSADAFSLVEPPGGDKRGYPQVFHLPGSGFLHLFTIYQPGRGLFVRTSPDGTTWSPKTRLADMQGHYQVSWRTGPKVATMFNRHPGNRVDERTDLFYLQTTDFGATWTTADGTPVSLPVTCATSPCRVFDYSGADKLVYLNDLNFDKDGTRCWRLPYEMTTDTASPVEIPSPLRR